MSLFEVEPFFFFFCKKGFHVNLTSGKLLEFSNWELTKRSFSRFLVFFFSRKILIWEVFVREACTTPLIWLTVGGCSFSFHEHTSYEAFHVNLKHNRYFWFSLKTIFSMTHLKFSPKTERNIEKFVVFPLHCYQIWHYLIKNVWNLALLQLSGLTSTKTSRYLCKGHNHAVNFASPPASFG